MRTVIGVAALGSLGLLVACGSKEPPAPLEPRPFSGGLLLLVDADMPAFAYADGVLSPRLPMPDAAHRILWKDGAPELGPPIPAGSTVTHWPGAAAVSRDGRHAFVVEGRGPAPPDVESLEDVQAGLPTGRALAVLSLGPEPRRIEAVETMPGPNGVAIAPDGSLVAVTTYSPSADVQLFPFREGRLGEPITVDVATDLGVGADRGRITGLAWSPDGDRLALNLGGAGVLVTEILRDGAGRPTGLAPLGEPLIVGDLLSQILWAPSGGVLYALDTGWGPSRLNRVLNDEGAIHVVAVGASGIRLLETVPSGLSSESFAISPDGTRLATLNMARTYLPDRFPTSLVPGRRAASVSLLAADPATGLLSSLGEPLPIAGTLPQGIAFDAEGDDIAVAVFQDRDPAGTEGWVEFLRIEGEGMEARLAATDTRLPTPRGAHFLVPIGRDQ